MINFKKILIVLFLIFFSFNSFAQFVEKIEDYKFSFETPEKLENYAFEQEGDYFFIGYDNSNYAVDISIISFEKAINQEYINDPQYAANNFAQGLGFENIIEGGKLENIEKSYYVKVYEYQENPPAPVFVIVFLNNDLKLVYEATVYCYNLDEEAGLNIINSFQILN